MILLAQVKDSIFNNNKAPKGEDFIAWKCQNITTHKYIILPIPKSYLKTSDMDMHAHTRIYSC